MTKLVSRCWTCCLIVSVVPSCSGEKVGDRTCPIDAVEIRDPSLLVDDFESDCSVSETLVGACRNDLGFPAFAFSAQSLRAANKPHESARANSLRPHSRRSLTLEFSADADTDRATYVSYLRPPDSPIDSFFDASGFDDLVFEVRGDVGGEKLEVRLADTFWSHWRDAFSLGPIRRFLASGITRQTQTVRIPLARIRFLTERARQNCIRACEPIDSSCQPLCMARNPRFALDRLSAIAIELAGSGRVHIDDLRFEMRSNAPQGDLRRRAADFIDRMRGNGVQREYDEDERHPDFDILARNWRVWAYTQGIALANATRRGQQEHANELATRLVADIAHRTSPETGELLPVGWNFSWNAHQDTFRDIRVVTGASSWVLTGLGRYISSDLFTSASDPTRIDAYQTHYRTILTSLLASQRYDGLFTAGWSVPDLLNATDYLSGGYEIRHCEPADKIVRCRTGGQSQDCGPRLELYYALLLCYGYPDNYFNDHSPLPELKRMDFVVTEHNLDMVATLRDSIENSSALGLDAQFVDNLSHRLSRLQNAIFDTLYVPSEGRFATGASAPGANGPMLLSPHTAIDNATWLAVHAHLPDLTSEQTDKLASALHYTITHFVKEYAGFEGDRDIYTGAHYFPPTFEDEFIDADPEQVEAYHMEGTAGLIHALVKFSNAFPSHASAREFAETADLLWFDLRRFASRHGFAYATHNLERIATTMESSTSALWMHDTFAALNQYEPAECFGHATVTDVGWISTDTGAYADVDISACGYQLPPMMLVSIETDTVSANNPLIIEETAPNHFRVRVVGGPLTVPASDWVIHWRALRYRGHHGTACSGRTTASQWERGEDCSVYVDVDARICDAHNGSFVARVASGTEQAPPTTTITALPNGMFRVSLTEGEADAARAEGWTIHWSSEASGLSAETGSCRGRTETGNTPWVATDTGIALKITTIPCRFPSTPSYVTSLVSDNKLADIPNSHWIHSVSRTGFLVEIHQDGLTPERANEAGLTVSWHGGLPRLAP